MDRDLKESAEAVFAEIGLDATTAVRLFFTKVAQTRSIPFRLKAESEFSPTWGRIIKCIEFCDLDGGGGWLCLRG